MPLREGASPPLDFRCTLPDGDVLVHCGDFASNPRFDGRTVASSLSRFDAWLAAQPHAHKVVIAGNHDPPSASFPRSGAIYAGAGVRSVEVGGLTLALVPWFSEKSRKTTYVGKSAHTHVEKVKHKPFGLPKGEVLVSHSPPRKVGLLDRCGSGDRSLKESKVAADAASAVAGAALVLP